MTATIVTNCQPLLKDEAGKAADAAGVPLSEFVAQVLARAIGRPELAPIPRKPTGRPRKQASA